MKRHLLLITIVCLAVSGLLGQSGTPSDPFLTLSQAQTVPKAGVYAFRLSGVSFNTFVSANGYVRVAIDYGNGVGNLPATDDLTGATRGILRADILATMGGGVAVAMTASDGTLNAVSTEATLVNRIISNLTLMNGVADNAINESWTGTGSEFLRVDASCDRAHTPLPGEVFHTCGDGRGMTWYPQRSDQALTYDGEDIADTDFLALWVRGDTYTPPTTSIGSPGDPFTSLQEALSVPSPGQYYFNLSGSRFDTYVDGSGYVQVALDYGDGVGRLPQATSLLTTRRGILTAPVLAKLTEAAEIRITSSVPNTLDAMTTNATLLQRITTNSTLKNRPADNQHNNDWIGTGSANLRVAATVDKPASTLDDEVFHTHGDGAGMTWYPTRGDQALVYGQEIASDQRLTLWVRAAAASCTINLQTPTVTPEGCPGADDGVIDVSASCDGCSGALEYSLDAATYQSSSQFAGLAPGTYAINVREVGNGSCAASTTAIVAAGVDNDPPVLPDLSPLELTTCNGAQTVSLPLAQDACSGTVTASTSDPRTFTTSGTYTINWSFADGNGNTANWAQQVTVYGPVLDLPFVEDVEVNSPTGPCWITDANPGDSWSVGKSDFFARNGDGFWFLPADDGGGHNDVLLSPAFAATAGTPYMLEFSYRSLQNTPEQLSASLVDAADGSVLRQFFSDTDDSAVYRDMALRFEVPADGSYRIEFKSVAPAGGEGLLLDAIAVYPFAIPTNGAAALVGDADDACTTVTSYGLNGNAFTRFLDPSGRLALEIDANGNNLGDVTVELRDYATPQRAPYDGRLHLSRHVNIEPENGPGPYTANGGVKVRLYYTVQELLDYNEFLEGNWDWADLVISHYSGLNEDCSLENSTDPDYTFELLTNEGDFGGTAHYLEFTTQSFSEFGATTDQAAPVVLTEFSAREDGPINRLAWTVASEIDFSHYEVQRSTTGTDFVAFAEVAGRELTDYASSDPAPAPLTYYRLKMVDYDGTYAYSKIASVQRAAAAPATFRLLGAFPVPTSAGVTLHYEALEAGELELRITNSLGRLLRRQTITARGGRNEQPVDLSGLPAATYQISLLEGGDVHTLRVIKQ